MRYPPHRPDWELALVLITGTFLTLYLITIT